jgi:tRNA(Ile)-lysidine synthase
MDLDFALAHCNFGLRGKESEKDEVFVRELASTLKKDFYVAHFNTDNYIKKNKVSLQMAARDLRYDWFHRIMGEKGIPTLVTAHHADDDLESFFINLSRGTGIDGLTGIPEKTDTLSRPLLKFDREQIMAYALKYGIAWREDASNKGTKYLRNKIRHMIVPILKELHPSFLDSFQATQDHLQQTAQIARDHITLLKGSLFKQEGDTVHIPVAQLRELSPQKAYLHALFKDYGFVEWKEIAALLEAMGGKELLSKTHRLVKHRDRLILGKISDTIAQEYPIRETDTFLEEPLRISIEEVDRMGETAKNILYVDKERLIYPLIVRKWKKGDYFYPFGMRGRKKVGKFFKDERMDLFSKENQWLLCSGGEIVWVLGKRADDRFKVAPITERILKIKILE